MIVVDFSHAIFRPATIDRSPIITWLVNPVIDNKLSATSISQKTYYYATACLLDLVEFMQRKYNSSSVQINRTMKYSCYTW